MKSSWMKLTFLAALVVPVSLVAQDEKKTENGDKDKKETQQVIITRKTPNDEKVVIEINGDKVTVNGKPIEDYKNLNGDITVRFNKFKNFDALTRVPGVTGNWSVANGNGFKYFSDDNRPMLGVTTEKTDKGAKINSITKEGAAEKIGLKEGDVITKVGDIKIEDADDLSAAIRKNKPGDKVEITYLRDNKEQKATAELTKWKGQNFSIDMKDMKFDAPPVALKDLRVQGMFRTGAPKLGLSVQDTDDGKGVKVIEVDEESTASKAGVKEGDIILSVDGTNVNSTDEIVKIIRDSKEKISVSMKVQRNGKTQTIDVKIPRKIKTADL